MQDKTAPQLSVYGAAECCRMTIFTGGFSMENIRIYEEDGYIHFIMRPEDLMRLRYSVCRLHGPLADPDENAGARKHDGWLPLRI